MKAFAGVTITGVRKIKLSRLLSRGIKI